jgi:hypothetical protein
MEVPIFLKLRMLWNGPLRNLATQPVSWPVKIETALPIGIKSAQASADFLTISGGFALEVILTHQIISTKSTK